ncbi:adaptin ear-binding coat-associated protein 1 [Pitangus sulphuratus]|nr:adaptin ear-binding coat-associated protein 1 [Pitangus sulphuratus]
MGILVDNKLSMSQQCVCVAKTANNIMEYMRKSIASSSRDVILPLCPAMLRRIWSTLTVGSDTVDTLWVRIKQQINNVDVTVGVYYRPSSHDNDADELLFEELRDTCKPTGLVLMGDFNLPEINWEHHTAGITQARIFLKTLYEKFMEQVLREPTQKDGLLDLLLVNRLDLVSKVEIGGCLGHSDHEVIEFKISVDRRKVTTKSELWT